MDAEIENWDVVENCNNRYRGMKCDLYKNHNGRHRHDDFWWTTNESIAEEIGISSNGFYGDEDDPQLRDYGDL